MFRLLLFFWSTFGLFAQEAPKSFFTPSDSLNIQRRNAVVITETVLGGATLVGLNQLWYTDYHKSNFHFINDNAEWLQMDKIKHRLRSEIVRFTIVRRCSLAMIAL